MLFLFLFVVISLLPSWDDMDICVKLPADDAWSDEDDKTGLLSIGVDISNQLYLKEWPISLPMVQMINIQQKYDILG